MNEIPYSTRSRIYAEALSTFGAPTQLVVALEEMSELQKEICKALRGEVNLPALAEELADVTIMAEQLRQIFNVNPWVCAQMDYKIRRLQQRIESTKTRPASDLSVLDDIFRKYGFGPEEESHVIQTASTSPAAPGGGDADPGPDNIS